ncbi:Cullin-associated NEDD8-dissociated protein 2 [Coemansia sp. RSA 2618]|nr:Cullin-associated NEDD8-dissociated protein 2 [Coemansia sp. RSA 2618]
MFSELFASATAAGSEGASTSSRLQAVKVVVDQLVCARRDRQQADAIWQQLVGYAQGAQSSLPDVLAQSLAVFAVTFPETFVPALAEHILSGSDAKHKAFYITAFRTVLADRHLSSECDAAIKGVLPRVLASISDESVTIRRLSLLALFTVIQSKPALLEGAIGEIEPALFQQTVINESLVRIVTMGPVKKRIDDGLDARRCAFQCVHMLVRMLPGAADSRLLAESIARGIADDHDIRLLVLQIINETASSLASVYAEHLDAMAAAIRAVQAIEMPKKAVPQEIEKHNEVRKSSISVLVALKPVAKTASPQSTAFNELVAEIADSASNDLSSYYKELTA